MMREPFVAEIRLFSFGFAPEGFTDCDGRLLGIEKQPALFSLLGWRYGGDGQGTFALPTLRSPSPNCTWCIATGGVYPSREQGDPMDEPYVGEIRMFGGKFAPPGWIVCDGRELPIEVYSELYDVIGRTYGGGIATFAVPSLSERPDSDVTVIIAAKGISPLRRNGGPY